jgi:hypothetical protein
MLPASRSDEPQSVGLRFACMRILRAAAVLSVGSVLAGCMTAKIEENRQASTRIETNEAVVLLAKPNLEGVGTENAFLDCLERELVGRKVSAEAQTADDAGKVSEARSNVADQPFQIYADGKFVDALYPWLEPSIAPANADGLGALLARPGVGERVSAMGVRYIIWIDGSTRKTDGGGSVACGAGPGGAGCIGLGWWEKQSDYQATVWDLRDRVGVGDVTTEVAGTSVFIGAVVPIPIIMPVQSTACDRMAAQLKSFLVGDDQENPD